MVFLLCIGRCSLVVAIVVQAWAKMLVGSRFQIAPRLAYAVSMRDFKVGSAF